MNRLNYNSSKKKKQINRNKNIILKGNEYPHPHKMRRVNLENKQETHILGLHAKQLGTKVEFPCGGQDDQSLHFLAPIRSLLEDF